MSVERWHGWGAASTSLTPTKDGVDDGHGGWSAARPTGWALRRPACVISGRLVEASLARLTATRSPES